MKGLGEWKIKIKVGRLKVKCEFSRSCDRSSNRQSGPHNSMSSKLLIALFLQSLERYFLLTEAVISRFTGQADFVIGPHNPP